jgi:hypothetical protein
MSFLDLHKALCPKRDHTSQEEYLEHPKPGTVSKATGPRAKMFEYAQKQNMSQSVKACQQLNGAIHARTEKPSRYRCSCRPPLRSLLSLPRVEA